ncbi:MAG TPA: hypothetical protein VFV67_28830 [Actinophytocola sp.]|uniref:hypothetical protein n=1 Tax=Actinophytocola sp. TaxID=1872138 RepID=UPI002DBE45DB|nr:hypothetical protein [Actinophytocola sp.]HEU5474672.1 hypothetical protein [Actinophytocola sp.]
MRMLLVVGVPGRIRTAMVVATAWLALVACSDSSDSGSASGSGPTSSTTSGDAATAWMERVCQAAGADFMKLTATPELDLSDPEQAVSDLLAYVGTMATALGTLSQAMREAGPPPTADGQQMLDETTAALDAAKKTLDDDRAAAEQALATDPAALEAAMNKITDDMDAIGDPLAKLDANKELDDASKKAPSCVKLEQTFDPSSTAATPTS